MSVRKIISVHNCTQYKPRKKKKTTQEKYRELINQIQKANGEQVKGHTLEGLTMQRFKNVEEVKEKSLHRQVYQKYRIPDIFEINMALLFSDKYVTDYIFQINKGVKAGRIDPDREQKEKIFNQNIRSWIMEI